MYGVEVGCLLGVVEVKHSTEPHDRQHQGEEHQCRMKELPREFILTPGQRDAVQHSSCSEEAKQLKMVCLIKCAGHIKLCCCLITASAPDASTQGRFRKCSVSYSVWVQNLGSLYQSFKDLVTKRKKKHLRLPPKVSQSPQAPVDSSRISLMWTVKFYIL